MPFHIKAAQLVDVQGEIKQLVEVKLNVVQAPASHVLPSDGMIESEAKEIKDLAAETSCLLNSTDPDGKPK